MKKLKFQTLIILFFFPFIASTQNEIKPEWIEKDIAIFNHIFERDNAIKEKFFKHFKLQVNPHYFNDSVYIYSSTNNPIFQNYKMHVAEYLGKQKNLNLSHCEFEHNLLNKPTGKYQFDESYFKYSNDYPPVVATNKLIEENRIDCLFNIIKGYSLPGRMYGVTGILELVRQNKYALTFSDKELLRKVLELDLYVEGGHNLITHTKYADCINNELLKLIEK